MPSTAANGRHTGNARLVPHPGSQLRPVSDAVRGPGKAGMGAHAQQSRPQLGLEAVHHRQDDDQGRQHPGRYPSTEARLMNETKPRLGSRPNVAQPDKPFQGIESSASIKAQWSRHPESFIACVADSRDLMSAAWIATLSVRRYPDPPERAASGAHCPGLPRP